MKETRRDGEFLTEIRDSSLNILRGALRGAADVALVDVPNQRNVGDALILAGELQYLRQLGVNIRYVADLHFFDPDMLRRAMPNGVVLLHGGGNFGDLWLGHQEYREQVVSALHDYPVVQLPQSVYFRDTNRASSADRTIGAHPDFMLLLRDADSRERAAKQLPSVRQDFCYDMALGYSSVDMRFAEDEGGRTLVLARQDKERAVDLARVVSDSGVDGPVVVTDWNATGGPLWAWRTARAAARGLGRVRRRLGPQSRITATLGAPLQSALWTINRASIAGGVRTFSDTQFAVVDRLHAHVLAGLLGIDHVVMDNSYGKVGALFREYTGRFSTARFASSVDEARELIVELNRAR